MNRVEIRHLDSETRFFMTLLAFAMFANMVNPCILIFLNEESLYYKAAELSGYPRQAFAALFAIASLLVLPNMIGIIGWRNRFSNRRVVKAAVFGFALSGVVWAVLSYTARELYATWAMEWFLQKSLISLAFAAGLGLLLNNQLKRIHIAINYREGPLPPMACISEEQFNEERPAHFGP